MNEHTIINGSRMYVVHILAADEIMFNCMLYIPLLSLLVQVLVNYIKKSKNDQLPVSLMVQWN